MHRKLNMRRASIILEGGFQIYSELKTIKFSYHINNIAIKFCLFNLIPGSKKILRHILSISRKQMKSGNLEETEIQVTNNSEKKNMNDSHIM